MANEEDPYEKCKDDEEHLLDTDDGTDWIASWLNLKGDVTITITKTCQPFGRFYGVRIQAPECELDVDMGGDRNHHQAAAVATMFAREQLKEHVDGK